MESLKKCVFLFGAGVSVGAGCKTSNQILRDLLSVTKSIEADSEWINYADGFRDITRMILASLDYQFKIKNIDIGEDYHYSNIEDFLKVLRKLIYRDDLIPRPLVGNWSDEILKLEIRHENKIFTDFLKFIVDRLKTHWLKVDRIKAGKLLHPIQLFLDDLPSNSDVKLNVFTLNYDLLFESILNSGSETNICNGFSKDSFDALNFQDGQSRINYYKLHGSLDWSKTEEGKVLCSPKHDIQDDPVIIFGEDNKMLSYDPFFSLLVKFRECLDNSSLFVVIGYGFQDAYINNLLLQSVNEGNKKLLIVEPYAYGEAPSVTDEECRARFLRRLEITQKSNDSLGIENLNYKLSDDRFEIIRVDAENFFDEYFADGASKLCQYIADVEVEELPF